MRGVEKKLISSRTCLNWIFFIVDFDCSMKEIDNRQPSDGLTKTCKKSMALTVKWDMSLAKLLFWEIRASKLVVLSSKNDDFARNMCEKIKSAEEVLRTIL